MVTDAGDVYNYNIMTTRYKKGDGIHVANVCSGNVIVSVYADFRKEDEAERSLEEIERILRSLKIDETEALESFPSDAGEEGMQVVGNETVGYVSVPDTWVKFTDLDGGTDFQYSNIEGTAIITMNIFDTKGLSDEQKAALDTRSAASSVWYNLENNDVTDISGATVKIGTYDALQVYGSFTSEDHGLASYIVCWIFEDENGIMHYVSAEAPVESASEVVSYVESSFTLTLKE